MPRRQRSAEDRERSQRGRTPLLTPLMHATPRVRFPGFVVVQLPAAARAAPVAAASAVRSFRAVPARRNEEMFADDASNYTYQQAAVTAPAPAWSCTALVNGEFKTVSSSDYKGKW